MLFLQPVDQRQQPAGGGGELGFGVAHGRLESHSCARHHDVLVNVQTGTALVQHFHRGVLRRRPEVPARELGSRKSAKRAPGASAPWPQYEVLLQLPGSISKTGSQRQDRQTTSDAGTALSVAPVPSDEVRDRG